MSPTAKIGELKPAAALVLLFSTTVAVHAAEHRIECPLKVEAESLQVVKSPAGWTAFVPGEFWLHSAGPMDGPPSIMAVLKEDVSTKRHGKKITTKWDMSGVHHGGKWMACNYGYTNDVILSRRIDDNTSECTVTTTEHESGKNDLDILCKW